MDKIYNAVKDNINNDLPNFKSGDIVKVGVKVIEGNRSRVQQFEGTVIAISAGSACTTEEVEPSYVLLAIGLNEDQSHEAIRIGLGRFNTTEEVKLAIEEICDAVKELEAIRA